MQVAPYRDCKYCFTEDFFKNFVLFLAKQKVALIFCVRYLRRLSITILQKVCSSQPSPSKCAAYSKRPLSTSSLTGGADWRYLDGETPKRFLKT